MIPHFIDEHMAQVGLKYLATHPRNQVWTLDWICFKTINGRDKELSHVS